MNHTASRGSILGTGFPVGDIDVKVCEYLAQMKHCFRECINPCSKIVGKGPFKCYVMQMGVGGYHIFWERHYEGVRFNVICVTRGWVGVQFSGKRLYVTLEWPLISDSYSRIPNSSIGRKGGKRPTFNNSIGRNNSRPIAWKMTRI